MNEIGSSRVFWFICGCVLSAVVFGVYSFTFYQHVHAAQNTNQQGIQQQMQNISAQLTEADQERDACRAKFSRETVLYDPSEVFGIREKTWIIPADITPQYVGARRGAQVSHYDPKTQDETVKQPAQ
ncbi:MAG: hypothetical protein WBD87_12710 [Candidatus Acidiferrales bacterium]